jgi:hypothetical protein
MSQATDVWYVRLPDGRVVRAKSTESVRHHLRTGRIPRNSWVRRTQEEDWAALARVTEFADLARARRRRRRVEGPAAEVASPPPWAAGPSTPSGPAARDDRMQLQTVGVRGMVEELLTAVDSTLNRTKFRVTVLAVLLATVSLLLVGTFLPQLDTPWDWVVGVGAGLVVLIIGSVGTSLLTQMTFVELSRARPARWEDATWGLGRHATRVALAYLVVIGLPVLALVLLGQVPQWVAAADLLDEAREAVLGTATVLKLVLGVALGPLLGLSLLLGPILIVEEFSAGRGIRDWCRFIRQHFGRVFLYEALAAALAAVASLPLIVPVAAAAPSVWAGGPEQAPTVLPLIRLVTWGLLAGLALTPLAAYLVVANVFIYLNLRYEQGPRR